MKQFFLCVSILVCAFSYSHAQQPPVIKWQKCYGGSLEDFTRSLELTADGGLVFCAPTESSDGDVTGNHGDADFWLVKLTASGSIDWKECLGGSADDYGWAMKQTSDLGYIMTGFAISTDGDITNNLGNYDYWVVKTNASGNIEWANNYGGSRYDAPYSIEETSDHGYLISGSVKSNDTQVTGYHGGKDAWVIKLDSVGNLVWETAMGGTKIDDAFDAHATSDGGCIAVGNSESINGDVIGNHGGQDFWVEKLNASGNLEWAHSYGGSDSDMARFVQVTPDGGCAVIGFTASSNGDVTGNHGLVDMWFLKLSANGTIEWQKCYGGSGNDYGRWINLTSDGGYIIAGASGSGDGSMTQNHGGLDYWIAKIDASGNIVWQKSLGGSLDEYGYVVQSDAAGNYYIGGYAESNDGDVSGNHGDQDVWVVKLSPCNITLSSTLTNETCPGVNGKIDLTVSGGNAPITYAWSNGATTQDVSTLDDGNYTVNVTDNLGCTSSASYAIAPLSYGVPANLKTQNITSTSAKLAWTTTGVCNGFRIQWRLTSSSTWTNKTVKDSTKVSFKLTGLSPLMQYEWRIRENCGSSSSAYSASKTFTTLAARESDLTGEEIMPVSPHLYTYPNPSSGTFMVAADDVSGDQVTLQLTDLAGRVFWQEKVAAENGTFQIDLFNINTGCYLLKMNDAEKVYTTTVMIER